ncbi:MAG: hypothetical protein IT531_06480 [Burkholderiales bacterium]|nr:hypothetical protein [Burkholderiales bacterium]
MQIGNTTALPAAWAGSPMASVRAQHAREHAPAGAARAERERGSAAAPEPAAEAAASARITRKERGALDLVTQDGDVVRIRFRARESQQVSVASATAASGAQGNVAQVDYSQRSRTRLEVQGDLDADELKAIQDFVGQVDALAAEFFAGDIEAAFAAGSALHYDAAEIARYSLKLSLSERVRAVGMECLAAPAGDIAGAAAPAGVASGAAANVATAGVAASAASSGAGTTSAESGGGTSSRTSAASAPAMSARADQPAATTGSDAQPMPAGAEASAAPPPGSEPTAAPASANPLATIGAFVQRLFAAADQPLGVQGYKLAWSVKVAFAAEVIASIPPPPQARGGMDLLTDVLGGAATQAGAQAPSTRLSVAA